jgi:hypothetical protein
VDRLKPQDVVLALKLVVAGSRPWRQVDLARALHLSASEVNHGLRRLSASRLYDADERRVMRANLRELLVHGVRYVFPAQLGEAGTGMPTAHSAKPLADHVRAGADDGVVWRVRGAHVASHGHVIEPLYRTAPQAAAADPSLHELLALVDALRVGRARERKLAAEELGRRLEAA